MHSTRPSPEILQRVQLIIRRDLKLGADVQIPPDMPFFGGDVDLDSLDILLLVTSIEKEFGVKIPSDQVGKEVFENVATLASYVEKTVGCGGNAAPKPAAADATGGDPLERLPHGPEFRFITRLTSAKPGEEATGVWEVSGEEPFFKGHFPGNPLVPGVLLTEALAQLSGLAGAAAGKGGMLAQADMRFQRSIAPPATITLRSKVARVLGELQQFEVCASVGDQVVASGTITLHRPQ